MNDPEHGASLNDIEIGIAAVQERLSRLEELIVRTSLLVEKIAASIGISPHG